MTHQPKILGLMPSSDPYIQHHSLNHNNELLQRFDGLPQPRQLGDPLIVVSSHLA